MKYYVLFFGNGCYCNRVEVVLGPGQCESDGSREEMANDDLQISDGFKVLLRRGRCQENGTPNL